MIEDLKHKFKNYKPYINGYKNMKRASVLIPIVKKDDTHYILFQVRSKNLKTQPNEISFPGGKIEINECPLDAVIRETCEELGTNVKNVNIISELDLLITPGNMINNIDEDNILLKEYIRIYKNVEKLKEYITKYLFEKNSSITQKNIGDLLLNIKSEENLDKFINYIDVDIHSLEEKFKNLNMHLGVNIDEINLAKEEIKNEYVNRSYNEDFIVSKEYINEIINCIKDENMYSLRQKSRYGSLNMEGKIKYLEDIEDFNEDEKGGMYSPILVIYRPAKYLRGSYILEDTYYVYIKRQPLNALINQEKLNEKGIDGMGSIIYKKLKHDLTNENLQEILAEIYIYANKNNLNFENIKLTDISSNRLWLTSERLKKEFKELRYYHKNLTQKIKDIYDSTGAYYTQIGGKYIFNTRDFAHCYKTYKSKDING